MEESGITAAVIASVITGVLSGALGSYVAIKVLTNDIKWINKILDKHDKEIDRLHGRLSSHVSTFHANGTKGD